MSEREPWEIDPQETTPEPGPKAEPPDNARRPMVILATGDKPAAARRVKKLLISNSAKVACPASDKVFRRGTEVVHLSRNELEKKEDQKRGHDDDYHVADDLLIRASNEHWFGDLAERVILFMRTNQRGDLVPAEPSAKLLNRVVRINTTMDFAPLMGTTETPTLRQDHSLLDTPGYDRKSGLYYDPGRAEFPPIPDKPTKADALKALDMFIGERGILRDFPFTDAPAEPKKLSQAVALAMMLTSVTRRTMRTAPMFAIDAFEAQSGKTLLGSIAGALATGREIAVRPWPTDEYQRKNDLAMALEAGDPVILYDNLGPDSPLDGESFNLAITSPMMKTRRLGSNSGKDEINVPTNALLIGTGNHMVIAGDMAEGRALVIRIIPDRALWQRNFLYPALLEHVLANRPALVAAALTILRAYVVAKDKREPTKFRHREWGNLIANAVAWLGLPDPCLAEQRSKGTDPLRDVRTDIVRTWVRIFGTDWQDVHALIGHAEIAKHIAGVKGIDATRLTWKTAVPFLRDMIGLPIMGFRVEHIAGDGNHRPARWRLAPITEDAITHFEVCEEFASDPLE